MLLPLFPVASNTLDEAWPILTAFLDHSVFPRFPDSISLSLFSYLFTYQKGGVRH